MAIIRSTTKITKNVNATKAGEWLKTLTQKEREKLDKKVTKQIQEFNFLNSANFPRLDKYAGLSGEEISVTLNEFKSNNIRPASKEAKRFFSFWKTGRNLKNYLLRELFPKRFFDPNMLDDTPLLEIKKIKRKREELEQERN